MLGEVAYGPAGSYGYLVLLPLEYEVEAEVVDLDLVGLVEGFQAFPKRNWRNRILDDSRSEMPIQVPAVGMLLVDLAIFLEADVLDVVVEHLPPSPILRKAHMH